MYFVVLCGYVCVSPAITCDAHLTFDVTVLILAVADVAVLPDRFTVLVPLDRIGDADDARDRERFADLDLRVTVIDHLVQIVQIPLVCTFCFRILFCIPVFFVLFCMGLVFAFQP